MAASLLGPAASAEQRDVAPLLDASADRIVKRAFVPSPERKVGEVRLIVRGEANVVQTLLYTKVLSRIVGEIRKKETANWPPAHPGHEDATRYLEELSRVQKLLWNRMPENQRMRDRRQHMLIEFVLAPRDALVMIGAFAPRQTDGEVTVARREPMVTLEPSRDYVKRNMRLIAADSFGVDEAALGPLLEPLELIRDPAASPDGASSDVDRSPP